MQIHKTVFETKIEKRCNLEFKKVCWNSFKQQPTSETVHVCTTTPEKLCNLEVGAPLDIGVITRLDPGLEEECHVYYTTNCETKFQEKEVEEELPICNEVAERRCENDGENCIPWYYPAVEPDARMCTPYETRDFNGEIENMPSKECKV